MQATKVLCPLCSGVTTVEDTTPAGQNIVCQVCRGTFTRQTAKTPELAPPCDTPWWVQDKQAGPAAPGAETIKAAALESTTPSTSVPAPLHAPRVGKLVDAGKPVRRPKPVPIAAAASAHVESSSSGMNLTIVLGLLVVGFVVLLGIGSAIAALFFGAGEAEPKVGQAPEPQQRSNVTVRTKNEVPGTLKKESGEAAPAPAKDAAQNEASQQKPQPAEDPPKNAEQAPEQPGPKNQGPQETFKGPPPGAADKSVVTAVQQKQIDEAIDRGVKFLLQVQLPEGSWQGMGHALGTTALPALTLLECGISPRDARIAAAADFVRKHWADNHQTYEISLAILFLDKLIERKQAEKKAGDKKDDLVAADKQTIQALALRLIAGQTANGGWDYECPTLSNSAATNLLSTLVKYRPKMPATAVDTGGGNLPTGTNKGDKGDKTLINPSDKSKTPELPNGVPGKDSPKGTSFLDGAPDLRHGPLLAGPPTATAIVEPLQIIAGQIPKAGKDQPPGGKDLKGMKYKKYRDDNSNTQFAMMALWAARRHDIPVETALLAVEQRFRVSQVQDGGWSYLFKDQLKGPKPSMTCVGLIGIALGQGSTAEIAIRAQKGGAGKTAVAKRLPMDAVIRDGLKYLAANLEERKVESQVWPMGLSLYFMWSVERVAVLYDLTRIEGKDWYRWGFTILLDAQRANGSWETHSYPGASATLDTCFALLFLKRVNLVQDLTDLQLYMAVPETEGSRPKTP
jgi:hypothetical protein